jgi:hypothetical protein
MPIILDAADKSKVTSATWLEAELGAPAMRLMIFSGIAAPELTIDDDDDILRDEVIVRLGVAASVLSRFVAQVALASIENDESAFVYATEAVKLEIDPQTSELQLRVQAAVMGDESALHRFSYQVVAHVTKVASRISGTIRSPRNILDLSNKTLAEVQASFLVVAHRVISAPPGSGGTPTFDEDELIAVATGTIESITAAGEDSFLHYVIDGCPFNTPLVVLVKVSSSLKGLVALQVPGPRPVFLTSIVPAVAGVDFAVVKTTVP